MEEKDKNTQLEVIKYLQKGDRFVLYIFNKTNKISYAIYIVTDLIKDSEPLKWKLRQIATDAVSLKNFIEEKSCLIFAEKSLLEIESYVELCKFANIVSEMNADVVLREVRSVLNEIKERSKTTFYPQAITGDFFNVPNFTPEVGPSLASRESVGDHKSHKGQNVLYDFYDRNRSVSNSIGRSTQKPSTVQSTGETKGQRQDQILKIIKEKKLVTIKDITDRVTDCSEKTVQRILTSLVLEGVLKKTGERRWSKYSL